MAKALKNLCNLRGAKFPLSKLAAIFSDINLGFSYYDNRLSRRICTNYYVTYNSKAKTNTCPFSVGVEPLRQGLS